MRSLPAMTLALAVAVVLAGCQAQEPAGSPSPASGSPSSSVPPGGLQADVFVSGLTIPWAVGSKRIEQDGSVAHDPGEWPGFPVNAIRLWDTRTAWLHLEPADDEWDFSTLDAHLTKAAGEGVDDVTLVLASTPRWAAVRETPEDAPWLGPGSASPPADVDQWRQYVRTVATRYVGRIHHYEIGNEPNLLTFWNGTVEEFAELVRIAAEEIAAADPSATILANAGLVRRPGDLDALDTWLAPVAGSPLIDAVTVHFYPKAAELPQLPGLMAQARDRLGANGFDGVPMWVTEVNVQDGSSMSVPEQESAVGDLTAQVEEAGFDRAYWYAWTALGPLNLIQLAPGTVGAKALVAG